MFTLIHWWCKEPGFSWILGSLKCLLRSWTKMHNSHNTRVGQSEQCHLSQGCWTSLRERLIYLWFMCWPFNKLVLSEQWIPRGKFWVVYLGLTSSSITQWLFFHSLLRLLWGLMQNDSSETLLRAIFLYLLLNVKYLVFSVTLGNYYIVKYTWNLLDAEEHLSLKVVKVEKSR